MILILSLRYRVDPKIKLIIPKGHNSAKDAAGVMVLILCQSSADALYLYQVS